MLPVEAPCTYSFAVPSRIVLWQYVGDLRLLDGTITIEKWPARGGAQTRDPELVYAPPLATRPPPEYRFTNRCLPLSLISF